MPIQDLASWDRTRQPPESNLPKSLTKVTGPSINEGLPVSNSWIMKGMSIRHQRVATTQGESWLYILAAQQMTPPETRAHKFRNSTYDPLCTVLLFGPTPLSFVGAFQNFEWKIANCSISIDDVNHHFLKRNRPIGECQR